MGVIRLRPDSGIGETMKTSHLIAVAALAISFAIPSSLFAASTPTVEEDPVEESKPYISSRPTDGVFKVVVLGDSLADGLYSGLSRLNSKNDQLKIKKASKVNTGLVRSDRYDWNRGARKIAKTGKYDIAVVLLGLNDLQTFREKGKAHHFQQKGWEERYQARLEQMITDLQASDMAVYWVGIPITSPRKYQKEYAYLNDFFQRASAKYGLKYIDTWSGLANANGKYSPFWKDEKGKKKQIRMRDGVHFTPDGYMIFASFLNDVLQKDLAEAAGKQASQ